MRKELEEKLFEKYPDCFKERYLKIDQSAMCFGFQHGDGWFEIIDDLCQKLEFIKNTYGVGIVAKTVKEKFGTLRFYSDIYYLDTNNKKSDEDIKIIQDIIFDLIITAEQKSTYTCEECSDYATLKKHGYWMYTRCYTCWKKLMKDIYKIDIPENEINYKKWYEDFTKKFEI